MNVEDIEQHFCTDEDEDEGQSPLQVVESMQHTFYKKEKRTQT